MRSTTLSNLLLTRSSTSESSGPPPIPHSHSVVRGPAMIAHFSLYLRLTFPAQSCTAARSRGIPSLCSSSNSALKTLQAASARAANRPLLHPPPLPPMLLLRALLPPPSQLQLPPPLRLFRAPRRLRRPKSGRLRNTKKTKMKRMMGTPKISCSFSLKYFHNL